MRRAFLLAVLTAAVLAAPAAAASTAVIPPSADVGFPFWCDWSYDWESRCFREDGARLPVGGAGDKVWRAGLRFSLDSIPAGTTVTSAELHSTSGRGRSGGVRKGRKAVPCQLPVSSTPSTPCTAAT